MISTNFSPTSRQWPLPTLLITLPVAILHVKTDDNIKKKLEKKTWKVKAKRFRISTFFNFILIREVELDWLSN